MHVPFVYNINTENATASLNVYVNGQTVSTYSLSNGQVTMSARNQIDVVTIQDLRENVININKWLSILKLADIYSSSGSVGYKEEWDITYNDVNLVFRGTTGPQITNANGSGNSISFSPRTQITISLILFKRWAEALLRFDVEMRTRNTR